MDGMTTMTTTHVNKISRLKWQLIKVIRDDMHFCVKLDEGEFWVILSNCNKTIIHLCVVHCYSQECDLTIYGNINERFDRSFRVNFLDHNTRHKITCEIEVGIIWPIACMGRIRFKLIRSFKSWQNSFLFFTFTLY